MANQSTQDYKPDTSERIEKGAERVKQSTSDAVDRTHEAVDRAADSVERGVHKGTDKVAHAAEATAEHTRETYDQVAARAGDWTDQARDYVREKPVQSVAIAIAAGWLIGRLLPRK
jgi:ElaB/YqjD/DUF883 family membrane-anchored ribosome-binding protein